MKIESGSRFPDRPASNAVHLSGGGRVRRLKRPRRQQLPGRARTERPVRWGDDPRRHSAREVAEYVAFLIVWALLFIVLPGLIGAWR